jgi:hypothetical protein
MERRASQSVLTQSDSYTAAGNQQFPRRRVVDIANVVSPSGVIEITIKGGPEPVEFEKFQLRPSKIEFCQIVKFANACVIEIRASHLFGKIDKIPLDFGNFHQLLRSDLNLASADFPTSCEPALFRISLKKIDRIF